MTTRLGICPVVIGPHIFPDTRFLSVRKIDEKAEKAAKITLPKPLPPPITAAPAPIPSPSTTPATSSNALTVKALTEIAATSPEFSAILQAVANKTATPEQHAALAQYMRAASLFGTPKTSLMANPATPTPRPITTAAPIQNNSPVPLAISKPIAPITTIPKSPITTPTPSTSPSKQFQTTQSAPIPPVPKSNPHAPVPAPIPPRPIATPVTRIPPPSGNLNPVPLPNVIRAPIATPVTRIPPLSTPINPPIASKTSIPPSPTPKPATPVTTIPQPAITTTTPSTPAQSIPGPSLATPSLLQSTPLSPQTDPMNFIEIGFELTEPGERLLIPRHTILEKFVSPQGGNNVLASFILTINNNTVYVPITLKLSDCPPRIWDSLHKYVYPQQIVVKEMERIMKECKRFEKSVLQLRISVEEEGFTWNGIKKENERKKYQRKKKAEVKEEDNEESPPKKKKSLVVEFKYPTKKEPVS